MIEAVFMPSKKSTVIIEMLLTATRERLSFIFIQTRNCLDIWSHHNPLLLIEHFRYDILLLTESRWKEETFRVAETKIEIFFSYAHEDET
jgi:hypothetical protein